jgi:pyruvate/2-oxoglutarate dehydrogenase complex dihydrolipoamide acyltransferase (E2) component
MKHMIKMPRVAETTNEVYLVSWSKSIGDQVEIGESLMEVETDKATVQIPSPVSGILKEQLFRDGEEISTGAHIASIESD